MKRKLAFTALRASRQGDLLGRNWRNSRLLPILSALVILSPSKVNAEWIPPAIGAPINVGDFSVIMAPTTSYADITIAGGAKLENYSSLLYKTGCDSCRYGLTVANGTYANGIGHSSTASTTLQRQTFLLNNSAGQVVNYGVLNNYSEVNSYGSVTNNSQLLNYSGSTFTNQNGAQVINNGQFVASTGAQISNAATASFQNNGQVNLQVGSTFNSWGAVSNTRDMAVAGFYNNAGSIDNTGNLKINNDVRGLYSNVVPATGGFNNYGSLKNQGNLLIGTSESTIMLGETPLNSTFVFNNGSIDNSGWMELSARLQNWTDGTIVNRSGATLNYYRTDGQIWNYGNLINESGAYFNQVEVRNFGNTRNDGFMGVGGMYYQNGGVTVNNGTMWASDIVVVDGLYTGSGRSSQLTLMNGADFSPGDSIGSSRVGNLKSYGNLIFDIASLTDFDVLNIDNVSQFLGGGVKFVFADLYTEKVGDHWDFIFGQDLGSFDKLNFSVSGLAAGTVWEIQTFDDRRSLVITSVASSSVPEPSSLVLMLSGLGLLGWKSRRRMLQA